MHVVGQPMDQSKSRVGEDSELEGTETDPCLTQSRIESHELQDQWSSSKTLVVILLVLKQNCFQR